MNLDIKQKDLDFEWVELVREAKFLGLSIEEIRLFLAESRHNSTTS